MQKKLFLKALAVGLLALLLLVPLGMIDGLVSERVSRQSSVTNEIAASYAGAQRIVGPILVVPYTEEYPAIEDAESGKGKRTVIKRASDVVYLFPEQLDMAGEIGTDFKHRGLFKTLVFDLRSELRGRFDVPQQLPVQPRSPKSTITFGEPYLALGVSDPRGLAFAPKLKWDGTAYGFERGAPVLAIEHPLRANLPRLALGKAQSIDFTLDLGLRGTDSLSVVPVAGDTKVNLRSTWPHPSFQGRFLPDPQQQYIGSDGFHAQWHITALASHAREQLLYTKEGNPPSAQIAALESLDLRFIEPINIYTESDRAIKYGFLFVALLFGAFFLFEVLKRLPIHPAQYLLVGLALAIFFLLLLSLSEHIAFAEAYLAAASASTGLLGFYLSFVLRSWRRGTAFGALMAVLYGALYGLLVSEDNALMMGSGLLFGLLAAAMWFTRNFDWYQLAPRGGKVVAEA
jgi:inner membrane protein